MLLLMKFQMLFDCSKLVRNWKNNDEVIICWHEVIVRFFWRYRVSFVKFSYWSKFHVNLSTCSGVMAIFVYKRLTRNPEIGNNPVCALSNIWRLGRVKDTKFGRNVSNEKLLNAATCQVYRFYRFWDIKGKPAVGKYEPHPD